MKKWVVALLFGSALVLGACGGGDNTGNDGDNNGNNVAEADPAEEIYKSNCAGCHGADLGGASGPELTDAGANFSADEIEDIIENGKGSMPPVNVNDDDREVLAEWLADKK